MSENLIQIGGRTATGAGASPPRERRPEWLRIKLATPAKYHEVRKLVDSLNLNTV